MNIIGRKKEQAIIKSVLESNKAEFVVIYGRRRVGKTFLIDEYFNKEYAFYATGLSDKNKKVQLTSFHHFLTKYGDNDKRVPKNWFSAFDRLIALLEKKNVKRDPVNNKKVVFIDELPWLDTAKSDFKAALDYFWNGYGSKQKDLVLFVCGSATSWILNNLLSSRGGFYKRITNKIYLQPFSLRECELLCQQNGINYSRQAIVECYMVFGGIPFYINLLNKHLSLAQNIDWLCFDNNGSLSNELDDLFSSLFKNHKRHYEIIKTLAEVKSGLARKEISSKTGIDGENLTTILSELEKCCFIRKYVNYSKNKSLQIYQIIDPFTLFAFKFLYERKTSSWSHYINTPSYYSWCGNAFEIVCLNNVDSIKDALGIRGIDSMEYAWSGKNDVGAQIDLLLDRTDKVINICEMKYSIGEFEIDKEYNQNLRNKIQVFKSVTKSKKTLCLTFITANGLKKNAYSDIVQNEIIIDDLFN